MIAFTLCSNNYLAQARSFGDSLLEYNPGYKFIIGLVDTLDPDIDYSSFPAVIIPVSDMEISGLDDLWKKYNIIEFNTCVKASFFKYLFRHYPQEKYIFYFDPDILIFNDLNDLAAEFKDGFDILVTPHILSPITPDGMLPSENLFLNYGIFNLGFIGLSRAAAGKNNFLDWWEMRTLHEGFNNVKKGYFVDQLWITLVPIFFDNVKILRHKGLNMAPWNLHERKINSHSDREIILTDGTPLVFYHFSSYKINTPEKMSAHYNRYTFETNPEMLSIYTLYRERLIANGIYKYSQIPCTYITKKNEYLKEQEMAAVVLPVKKPMSVIGFLKSLLPVNSKKRAS